MMKDIIAAVPKDEIIAELTPDKLMRKTNKGANEIYIITHHDSPAIMREIGRLREITFRDVGEGTNKSIDLDKFDKYYYHMFLWDNKENCLAGAYRMGLGKEIYKRYGIQGFYIQSLFRFEPELIALGHAYAASHKGQVLVAIGYSSPLWGEVDAGREACIG